MSRKEYYTQKTNSRIDCKVAFVTVKTYFGITGDSSTYLAVSKISRKSDRNKQEINTEQSRYY